MVSFFFSLSQQILLVEEQSTDIPIFITCTQKEPYTVFTYPNSEVTLCSCTQMKSYVLFFFELIPVMFQPQTRQVPLRPLITTNACNPQSHQFTMLRHTQNRLRTSIFHSTLSQLLGKWTAMTTDITVLTGQGPRTGFLTKWFY